MSDSDSDADVTGQALVARELRRHREGAGLSLTQLATRIGYSRTYIASSEKPGSVLVSANVVERIDEELEAGGTLIALRARADFDRQARRHGGAVVVQQTEPAAGNPSSVVRNVYADLQTEPPTDRPAAVLGRADQPDPRGHELPDLAAPAAIDVTASEVVTFNAEVQRRGFLAGVVAASVGAAVPEPLARLLDGLGADLPRRVGMADVEAVEAAADAYMGFDLARSGDLAATVAHSSLKWSTQLLAREMTESTRERLSSAVALLADRLGWSTYDSGASDHAGRMLTFALNHAAHGADRNLRAHIMLDLSTVVTDAGRPRDGVEILRAALGDERISAAERANLHAVCARHCASAGQQDSGLRHVVLAEEALQQSDTAVGPGWARQITYGRGHHDSALGLALFALGDNDGARQRLTAALEALDSGRTRTGLRCRIRLAALSLREGEKDVGEVEGYRVIEDVAGVASVRVRKDLQMLWAHAARYDSPGLAADLSRLLVSQRNSSDG